MIKKTGDWDAVLALFENVGSRLVEEIGTATKENGEDLVSGMVGHFENQDLGWAPLSPAYAENKGTDRVNKLRNVSRKATLSRLKRHGIAHSSKEDTATLKRRLAHGADQILIDTGTLMNNIRFQQEDYKGGFVGITRGRTADGKSIANVAAYHEMGTKNMPARPFLDPTIKEKSDDIVKRYKQAIDRVFDK